MLKDRCLSLYNNTNKSKKHCQEDFTCNHCCKCWINHKNQCQIKTKNLKECIMKIKEENLQLKKVNESISKEMMSVKKRQQQYQDLQGVKENIKEQVRKQLRKQWIADEFILKQKVSSLKSELMEIGGKIIKIEEERDSYRALYESEKEENDQNKENLEALKNKLNSTEQIIQNLQQKVKELTEKNNTQQFVISEKTVSFQKLQQALIKAQQNYQRQKQTKQGYQQQSTKTSMILKSKEDEIKNWVRTTEMNKQTINTLQNQAGRLSHIITNMDQKLSEQRIHEEVLKDQLFWTSDLAKVKNEKLEMMKADVRSLKCYL